MIRVPRWALALLSGAAVVAASTGMAPTSAASSTSLPGSTPAWATAANRVGAAPGSATVDFKVHLHWRNADAAAKYALAASTAGNATSRHFLTPAQFRDRFAPSASDVSAVKTWLSDEGFRVTFVPANGKYVEATGTVRQASSAFGTAFSEYRVQGRTLRSNDSALRVPSSLADVEAVTGLDESAALVHSNSYPDVFVNGEPCSTYWGDKTVSKNPAPDGKTKLPTDPSTWAPCGYAGEQLQGAYGLAGTIRSGTTGKGVTVAVIDAYASSSVQGDLDTYSTKHGLPTMAPGQFTEDVAPGTYNMPEGPAQDPEGWSGEETLDVEAVHTMAPGANILYVGSPNNYQDMNAALNHVVDKHLADIITNSYGFSGESLPPGYISSTNDILIQAAAEGISVFFSSGDSGDQTGGDPANASSATPDWPASSPWVTAVGGTSLGVQHTSQGSARLFELGWETGKSSLDSNKSIWNPAKYLYGSGGGTSRLFTQPSYQAGVVPSSISEKNGSTQPMRTVPDVSAVGDPTTGMLVGQTQRFPDGHTAYSEYRIGGTSLSSPLYAGMFALVMQRARHPYGLANPALYSARTAAYDITAKDVQKYDGAVRSDYVNRVDATNGYVFSARWFDFESGLTIHVGPKYDDVTGVGSPNGTAWLDAVAGYAG